MLVDRRGEHHREIGEEREGRECIDRPQRAGAMRAPHGDRIEDDECAKRGTVHEKDAQHDSRALTGDIAHVKVKARIGGRILLVMHHPEEDVQRVVVVGHRIEGDHEQDEGERHAGPEKALARPHRRRRHRRRGEPGRKASGEYLHAKPNRTERQQHARDERACRGPGHPAGERRRAQQEYADHVVGACAHQHVEVEAEKAIAQPVGRRIGYQRQHGNRSNAAGGAAERGTQRIGAGAHRQHSHRQPERSREGQPRLVEEPGERRGKHVRRVVIKQRPLVGEEHRLAHRERIAELRDDRAVDEVVRPGEKHALTLDGDRRLCDAPAQHHRCKSAEREAGKLGPVDRPRRGSTLAKESGAPHHHTGPHREGSGRKKIERGDERIHGEPAREHTGHPGRGRRQVGEIERAEREIA